MRSLASVLSIGGLVGGLVGACGPTTEDSDGGGSSESTDGLDCVVGSEFCPCTPGGGCDPGLVCELGLCLAADTTGSSSEGPLDTGGPDTGSDGDTTASSVDESTTDPTTSATSNETDTGIPDNCGNDELEEPEECDDGNSVSGDGCNADCTLGGQLVWEVVLDGEMNLDDWGLRLALDSEDNVIVSALTFTPSGSDRNAWVIKLDDDGQFEWEDVYDSAVFNSTDGYWGAAVGPGDEVIVSGWASAIDYDYGVDQVVRCFSPDGDLLWEHVDEVLGDGYDYDVAVDSAGDIVVVGVHWDEVAMATAVHLKKLDIDGNPVWSENFPVGPGGTPSSLTVDSAGRILIGSANGFAFVRRHLPNGDEDWTWEDGPGYQWIGGLATDSADDVLVAGHVDDPFQMRLARHFADDGTIDLETEWIGGYGLGAMGLAITVDDADRPVVGGEQFGNAQGEIGVFVRKHETDGDQAWLWEREALDGWNDNVGGIAVGSDGYVYATGKRHGDEGNDDVFVVKLTP